MEGKKGKKQANKGDFLAGAKSLKSVHKKGMHFRPFSGIKKALEIQRFSFVK